MLKSETDVTPLKGTWTDFLSVVCASSHEIGSLLISNTLLIIYVSIVPCIHKLTDHWHSCQSRNTNAIHPQLLFTAKRCHMRHSSSRGWTSSSLFWVLTGQLLKLLMQWTLAVFVACWATHNKNWNNSWQFKKMPDAGGGPGDSGVSYLRFPVLFPRGVNFLSSSFSGWHTCRSPYYFSRSLQNSAPILL